MAAFLGYLVGSIPTAVIVARTAGSPDPRTVGTGNAGATNVALTQGLGAGALVFVVDFGKGVLAVLAGTAAGGPWIAVGAAIGAVLGQVLPLFSGFRGGKGLATTFGSYSALNPAFTAAGVLLWMITTFVVVRRFVAGTVVALAVLAGLAAALTGQLGAPFTVFAVAACAIAFWAHRRELAAWRRGTLPTWRQSLRDNRERK